MNLPYNWDFIQNNISPEKLAELRRRFMEEWHSGNDTIKRYTEARELDDFRDEPRSPKNPHRKFTDEDYQEVVRTFDRTREDVKTRFLSFMEDMHADKRNLSPPKLKAQKKKIWDVRPGVRKVKAILDELWASAKKTKTISKSYVYDLLKKFEKYPEEAKKEQPKEFARPLHLVGGTENDHNLTLKTIEDLCRIYPEAGFQIRSDGGKEFNNSDVTTVHEKKGISWVKVSKPWDNPFAERGIRTIKYEYLNQVWIGNLSDFKKLAEVRIEATKQKQKYLHPKKMENWNSFYWSIPGRTNTAVC